MKKIRKLDKCNCDEMAAKVGWNESRTFKCPAHGQVTVDRRSTAPITPLFQPYVSPYVSPYLPISQPWVGDPPYKITTSVYQSKPTDQITFTS